jgi:hypothetical protein
MFSTKPKVDPDVSVDVLLVCALKDEYDQVLAVSDGLLQPGWIQHVGPRGWTVADGSFVSSTGRPMLIRATWASHMGREQAQAVASVLIQATPARCLAMSGICAGRRGKVNLTRQGRAPVRGSAPTLPMVATLPHGPDKPEPNRSVL